MKLNNSETVVQLDGPRALTNQGRVLQLEDGEWVDITPKPAEPAPRKEPKTYAPCMSCGMPVGEGEDIGGTCPHCCGVC